MNKQLVALTGLGVLAVTLSFYSASANAAAATTKPAAKAAQTTVKKKAPLGNLNKFRTITADTLKFAKAGDLKKGEKRITDMETKWDAYETNLKARDAAKWTQLDGALDKVLKAFRMSKPVQADCVSATQDMLTLIDSFA
jgi:hypothetical protein